MTFVLILFSFLLLISCGGSSSNQEDTVKGLIVPAYAWWENTDFWEPLKEVDRPKMIIIFNPDSGPGSSKDQGWSDLISFFKTKGHIPVGYVHTSYAERDIYTVEKEIDLWLEFYPQVAGFFVDEVSNTYNYYKQLQDYIKSKGDYVVILNPGTQLEDERFDSISDIIVYYEDQYGSIPENRYEEGAVIVHSFRGNVDDLLEELRNKGADWIWITDDTLPNPYDDLPSYFNRIVEDLKGS